MKLVTAVALSAACLFLLGSCSDAGRVPLVDGLAFLDTFDGAEPTELPIDARVADIDPAVCEFTSDGTLKGVTIDLSGNSCVYSMADVAAGISLHYRIVVEQELHDVVSRPLDAGQCDDLGPSGLRTLEKIHGNDQTYCICDSGLCMEPQEGVTLVPGEYSDTFSWDGRNWNGPSDTEAPKGAAFPPGQYTLVVRAEGRYGKLQSDFAVTATMKIHLEP